MLQLSGPDRVDMVLVQAGGNDVIRLRALDGLRDDLERVVETAATCSTDATTIPWSPIPA